MLLSHGSQPASQRVSKCKIIAVHCIVKFMTFTSFSINYQKFIELTTIYHSVQPATQWTDSKVIFA